MNGGISLKDPALLSQHAYVDGDWVEAESGARFAVFNPADGVQLASLPDLNAADTRRAIAAADSAFQAWRSVTAKDRAGILKRWHQLILESQEDLALLMTLEGGKPLAEARGEVAYGASFVEWFAEEAKRTYGDVIPSHAAGKRIIVLKEPVGVCAAITPWNFPNAMITRKCAPALAAGCTVGVKPPAETPLSALALARLAERAGLPKGTFQVITTSNAREVGLELSTNPTVRKLSFTGSTEVGRLLMRQSSDTLKKLSFELGGNAPFIVFDDADLDAAVAGAMASKYRNSGQTCVCANRLLIQDGIYDAFAAKLAEAVSELKVGPGTEPGVQQGPLINDQAILKVESLVADALAKGAQVVIGGRRHRLGGTFYEPTLLRDVTPQMAVAKEEIFGPVAPLFRFRSEEEAVALANDTDYGLAAYFYGRDIGRIWRVAEALEYGMVAVNEGILSTEVAPFGGVKQSGFGREGSKYGIDEYLTVKYVLMGGLSA